MSEMCFKIILKDSLGIQLSSTVLPSTLETGFNPQHWKSFYGEVGEK